MNKLLWLIAGVAGGFILAHYVNKDPRGHELLADVDARISGFTDRIGDAYREQTSLLAAAVSQAESAASQAATSAQDAAATARAAAAGSPD